MRVLWLCTLLIFIVFDVSISYAQGVQYLGSCGLPDSAKGIFVTDTIAYVANYSYGLNVINVADLTHPASIGHCDTPGNAQDVKVSGDYAYIADLEGGLRVADVSNPASPILVGHFDTTGACAISIDGAYAFVSFGWTGMYVFDISNPPNLNPYFNFMSPPSPIENIAPSGLYAYVACQLGGLEVFRWDWTFPIVVGIYDTPGEATDLMISGDYCYLVDGYPLEIINISDPTNPTPVSSFDLGNASYDVFLSGNFAFVACGRGGLKVLNVSDPTNPTLAASYDTPGISRGLYVNNNYVYLADSDSLMIFQFSSTVPCSYTPGDINDNGSVNGVDIVYAVNYLKGVGNPPPVDCGSPAGPCPESSPFYAAGDVNGNCAFNGIDITYFVRFLKLQVPTLLYCQDCPPEGR